MNTRRLYLVAYDITAPRRWRRVYRLLKRYGEHHQLSVFLCRLPPERMARLTTRLRTLIADGCDRLTVIDLGPCGTALARIGATDGLALPAPAVVL